jgi:glycogen operon protein
MWEIVVDTAGAGADSAPRKAGATIAVEAKSLMVLRAHVPVPGDDDHSVAASLSSTPFPNVPSAAVPSGNPTTMPTSTDAPSNEVKR